ncbi:hypothetical protein NPIL_127131 [Nephila pilipes]|uniref:Uncharacterized protein n=1 Tax=Nephila pilipes TaxID=299642 RepID=A0A8X6QTB7_NEPPI|nr:hypothetical protein NPIL_127131 [Nephila pilipes]
MLRWKILFYLRPTVYDPSEIQRDKKKPPSAFLRDFMLQRMSGDLSLFVLEHKSRRSRKKNEKATARASILVGLRRLFLLIQSPLDFQNFQNISWNFWNIVEHENGNKMGLVHRISEDKIFYLQKF